MRTIKVIKREDRLRGLKPGDKLDDGAPAKKPDQPSHPKPARPVRQARTPDEARILFHALFTPKVGAETA